MAKFGEIISIDKPVLIDFDTHLNVLNTNVEILRDVVAALGDKAKVIKIDIRKNEALADALRITGNPTFIIYKNAEIQWRQTGEQDANTLISLVRKYI